VGKLELVGRDGRWDHPGRFWVIVGAETGAVDEGEEKAEKTVLEERGFGFVVGGFEDCLIYQ